MNWDGWGGGGGGGEGVVSPQDNLRKTSYPKISEQSIQYLPRNCLDKMCTTWELN